MDSEIVRITQNIQTFASILSHSLFNRPDIIDEYGNEHVDEYADEYVDEYVNE